MYTHIYKEKVRKETKNAEDRKFTLKAMNNDRTETNSIQSTTKSNVSHKLKSKHNRTWAKRRRHSCFTPDHRRRAQRLHSEGRREGIWRCSQHSPAPAKKGFKQQVVKTPHFRYRSAHAENSVTVATTATEVAFAVQLRHKVNATLHRILNKMKWRSTTNATSWQLKYQEHQTPCTVEAKQQYLSPNGI